MKAPAPTGVVTILFTDIEGSTALWERLRDRFGRVLSEHDRVLRRILSETEGTEVKHEGDGLMVAFDRPSAAVAFALRAQSALATHEWPDDVGELRVRMGMHTGESVVAADPDGRPEYFGPTVNRAARIAAAGHGGQVLLSATTCDLVRNDLPEGASLVALGQYRLTGLEQPEAVYQLAHPDLPAEAFLPLRTLDRHSHNLPVQLTSFVGREEDLQRVVGMLSDPRIRLITLLGPGGVGKTRLALQAAAECAEQFNGGVWLVGLAEVSQPERVPEEIMATLGLAPRSARAPSQEVHDYLSVRELLLILDNFEQVIEAGPFVADLLRATTRVKCLVTSRRGLGIAGERRFHLAPMPVPDADAALQQIARFDSVGLLIERAREHRADWALTHDNAAATAELCARLDGIPLAIELAASRLRAMSVEEVLARLSSRFDLLASRQPDRPPRQRALASAFEWSHDLLSPASRALLAQLSIFRGGFVMGAAEAICDGPRIFDGVLDLCDHSFLSSQETAGRTRYLMLESIRGFAAARLEPELSEPLRARHAHYFLSFAQERDAKASGPDEATAFAELTDELDNLRAGMGWAVSTCNDRMAAEYAAALATFLWRCGHWQEQLECVDMGLEAAQRLDPPDVRLLGRLLYCRGVTAHDRGENQSAIEAGERGLRVAAKAGDSEGEILFLNLLALAARRSEEPARSRRLLEKALPLSREIGHPRCQGMTLHNLGLLAQTSGDPATAERFYREALPLRSEAGDERGVAETLNNLGVLAEADERLAQAQTLYRDALKSYVRLRGTLEIAVAVCNLGEIAHKSGDLAGAVELLAAAATALSELGSVHAEHAAQAFEGARAELSQEISPAPLPWREALLTAAEKALAEQAP